MTTITLESQLSANKGDMAKTKTRLEKDLVILNAIPTERNKAYASQIKNLLNQL